MPRKNPTQITILLCLCGLWLFPWGTATAQTKETPARITAVIEEGKLVRLTGNVHPLARAEFDRGGVADAVPMSRMLLLLKRSDEQESALQDYLESQQDKNSPNYQRWLSPQEFGAQFGPADADIQKVTNWLQAKGFDVARVYAGKTVIEFSGTAGRVATAFGTQIRNYQLDRKTYIANASDPAIPAALAPVVAGVVSLNNFPRKNFSKYTGTIRKYEGMTGEEPLFTFPFLSRPGNFYGLAPGDFATIYNSQTLISTGNDGTGQTIAIVGETNINLQDVKDFRTIFGLPANFDASNIILNGEDPGITSRGEEAEADLDIQWSGATAPGATIKYVLSASTPASAGVDLSALYIIEHNLAGVMSESYGECENHLGATGNAFFNSLWQQAAAQGITVIVSSGDGGSAGCDNFNASRVATKGLAVSGLASTPYNVSLGGTDFDEINTWTKYWNQTNDATGTSAKSYIPEIPWNENCSQLGLTGCGPGAPNGSVNIIAGSGGQSAIYGKPKWQMGVAGMPNDNHRDQPDVSMFASPGFDGTGYVYCQHDRNSSGILACDLNFQNGYHDFHIIGGTSASAPAFAGVMALVNQYQASHGGMNRQGNANYVLYGLAKKAGASCASGTAEAVGCIFNDVVTGNSFFPSGVGSNSVACQGGSPNCSVASGTGVLVDAANPNTEAWTAAAGYDMATGLGSVNISNLVTNWGSVSGVPTTTTLSLNPTTGIPHGTGQNVSVSITVTPKSATGDVSLIVKFSDGTPLGVDQFTLGANGSFSGTTKSLPGGTYTVSAHYAGDGTNAPSDSSPVTVTVGKESSQTFIAIPTSASLNASTVTYGDKFFIRMYVTNSSAAIGTNGLPAPLCGDVNAVTCPTGTVTLSDNGSTISSFHLNNAGYTRDLNPSVTTFVGGKHQITANYSGDNSYGGSIGSTTLTVTPAPLQVDMSSAIHPFVGISYSVQVLGSANVLGGVLPTGTISIYDGTTLINGPLAVGGTGGLPNTYPGFVSRPDVTFTTSGDHSITAKYSGDSNYAPFTTQPQIIQPQYQTTTNMSLSATSVQYGDKIKVIATVTGLKSPVISGRINFTTNFATVPGVTTTQSTDASGNSILTATFTDTPQQSEWYNADYSSDANYASSATGTYVNVNIPDFTLGPASGVSVIPVAGQAGSGQITVTPLSQTPSTVTLSMPTSAFSGYSVTLSPQQVSLNGSAGTATVSLTPVAGATAAAIQVKHAGFFAVKRGDWWLLSLATGLGVLFLMGLPNRRRRIRAALGLSVVCLLFFILGCGGGGGGGGGGGPTPTSIVLTTSNAKVAQNGAFVITATVTASKPLTGSVYFYNFGTSYAGNMPLVNGQAKTDQGYLSGPGLFRITATYSGDAANLPSTSAPLTQVITGTVPVTVQANTGGTVHYFNVMLGLQ